MSTFLFDFTQGKTLNPLEGITHFYVSPYQMDIWKTLNLAAKIADDDVELVIQDNTGMPLIVLPIGRLNLGKCLIRLNDDFSGKIVTNNGRRTIYFSTTKQPHIICIGTVC